MRFDEVDCELNEDDCRARGEVMAWSILSGARREGHLKKKGKRKLRGGPKMHLLSPLL